LPEIHFSDKFSSQTVRAVSPHSLYRDFVLKGSRPMSTPKGRILCTEDDPDTRDLLSLILGNAGYDVVCTSDASECLRLASLHNFDLYLMDNWMPNISGEALCKTIREFDAGTPILFYSGAAYESDKQRARDAGAQGYLVKPALEDVLLAEIVRIIAEAKIALPVTIVPPGPIEPIKPFDS
jgi:DNA-binding response OmpR family regulator